MVTDRISTWGGATGSMIIGIPVMTTVECLRPLRGAGHMRPDGMMIGARMVTNGDFQSTQESLGSMRGHSSCKVWWTEAELTEKDFIEIVRLDAGRPFLVTSVSAEPLTH